MPMAGRIFYGWIIAGVILTTWGISIGPRQSFSIFLLPFVDEFGSSRSTTAAAFSIHMALYALGGWVLGILMDRVGPRRIIAWSTGMWALILVLCSQLHSVWQLYVVYGILGGVATGGLSYVPNNTILSRWFVRYRGLASGIAQAGVPLGAAVYGPLAQLLIARLGWRTTHTVFGLFVAATALPLVLLVLRDDPREMGLLPDGARASEESGGGSGLWAPHLQGFAEPGLPRGYWPIFVANMLRGLTTYAILVHQVAYLVDVGFSRLTAASYFSVSFFLAVPGGLVAGAISDRIGRTRTYAGLAALYVIGYLSLLLVRSPSQVVLLSISMLAFGLGNGGVSPVLAAFLTDRLQGPRLGFLLGLQNIGFGVGATLGPYLAGLAFDWMGSYLLAFILMALSMVVSSLIISGVARQRPATSP
jgi:MFS family permease